MKRSRALLPWQLVDVSGPSMAPTLHHGDVVLVRHTNNIHPPAVVLARFRSMPDRQVIKRAYQRDGSGWQLRSDNEFAGGDSREHGIADVTARAVLVWRHKPGIRRWVPHRVR